MAHGESQHKPDLSARMREEWDRRVRHDYRYWMSDGVESDEQMWAVGRRDFRFIVDGLPLDALRGQTALEIGCGVGRLMRSAAEHFGRVIGVDVSPAALEQARRLLADVPAAELLLGNGENLQPLGDNSVDFVYSFAALGSMPAAILAGYLPEIARVLKPHGHARLQLYLGRAQATFQEDTIALRSFAAENFQAAAQAAGLRLESLNELRLPFQISDHQAGLVASLVFLRKEQTAQASPDEIARLLLPGGEPAAGMEWKGSETEFFMALARAKQHNESGQPEAVQQALEFAEQYYGKIDADIHRLLEELRATGRAAPGGGHTVVSAQHFASASSAAMFPLGFSAEYFRLNMELLQCSFPEVAAVLSAVELTAAVEVKSGGAGMPVVIYRGSPLIHIEKPERAAEKWAEQTIHTVRAKAAEELLVAGIAAGYQIEALAARSDKAIHVFEANPEILKAVLSVRDWRPLLERLSSLSTDLSHVKARLGTALAEGRVELIVPPQSRLMSGAAVDELRRALVASRGIQQLHPRIGVVGPMYGGSLPIARYTARALCGLKQRTMGYDLSPFYSGFKEIGGFLKSRARKDAVENQYVELLSQTVLEGLNERPVDILICLAQAPMTPTVLEEIRKRGIITVLWFVEDCNRFPTWKLLAPYFDYMFLIQRGECLKKVEEAGAGRAIYLPVGCDPDIHAPLSLSEEERARYGSQISFLGAGYNNRRHMFAHLANRDFKIWGTEWPSCMPFTHLVQEGGRRIEPEEYVKIFNASAINLNLHSSMERDGVEPFGDFVNPRTFELASAGAFQLVDERSLLPELFDIGSEIAVFHDGREMQEKINYYAERPEERAAMARRARTKALSAHTYQHRLKSMLEYIYADRYEQLKSTEHSGAWAITLREAKQFPELEARLRTVYERGEDPTFDSVIADIQTGKGELSGFEQRLLFLHHIRSQITQIQHMRNEKE
jgi:spore maturation protein CgeB